MHSSILIEEFSKLNPALFHPFAGSTVAISGATGLIGSLVCKALLYANMSYDLNLRVLPIVRTPKRAADCFEGWEGSGLMDSYVCDLSNVGADVKVDADFFLHAGCITQSKKMIEHPVDVLKTSVNGTGWVLRNCARNEARMVYVSSMEYYGTLPVDAVADESALGYIDLHSVRSSYPESKRFCECLCNSVACQYGVDVCCARLAQTFGAGVPPQENRAFAQFARSAMRGEDVVLRTLGLSEGNYVNSIDCVAALLLLLAKGERGEAYNVSNESSHCTIKEMARTAIDVLGDSTSQRVQFDVDNNNSSGFAPDVRLFLDSSKLSALGWSARYDLRDSFVQLGAYLVEQDML